MELSLASSSSASIRRNRSQGNRDAIRHSGRAQIRGKIRRVWRPRYLELVRNDYEFDVIASLATKEGCESCVILTVFPCRSSLLVFCSTQSAIRVSSVIMSCHLFQT